MYLLDFTWLINFLILALLIVITCGWAGLLLAYSLNMIYSNSYKRERGALKLNSPSVSVIVPARNEMRYLRRCLTSILSQNYKSFEIIVEDDCSNDETANIARSIQDKRIKLINLKNRPPGWTGKSWASHVGYLASAGRLLLFTDADSFFYNKEAISYAVDSLQNEGTDVLTGLPLIELTDFCSKLIMPIYNFFSIFSSPSARQLNKTNSKKGYLIGSFFIANRNVLDKIGGFCSVRASIQEDTDLGSHIKEEGFTISQIKISDFISALWSRDTRTLIEGIRRIVSYNFSNSRKNLALDIFMIFSLVTLPFVLLPLSIGISNAILLWTLSLCSLPIIAVAVTGTIKHRLNSLYSMLVLFGSAFLLTLFIASIVSLFSFRITHVRWKERMYERPQEKSITEYVAVSRSESWD